MALESVNLLTSLQVPDTHECVHAARHDPTMREIRIRRNPCQGTHEACVAQKNLGTREPAVVVQRPQPNGPVPRRSRYTLAAAHAYSANLCDRPIKCKLKLRGKMTMFELGKN